MGTLQLPQLYQQLLPMGLLGPVTPILWMDHPRALTPYEVESRSGALPTDVGARESLPLQFSPHSPPRQAFLVWGGGEDFSPPF